MKGISLNGGFEPFIELKLISISSDEFSANIAVQSWEFLKISDFVELLVTGTCGEIKSYGTGYNKKEGSVENFGIYDNFLIVLKKLYIFHNNIKCYVFIFRMV